MTADQIAQDARERAASFLIVAGLTNPDHQQTWWRIAARLLSTLWEEEEASWR